MFNNRYILDVIGTFDDDLGAASSNGRPRRTAVQRHPCLPSRLPNTSFLEREGAQLAPREMIRQMRYSPSLSSSALPALDIEAPSAKSPPLEDKRLEPENRGKKLPIRTTHQRPAGWKEPQPFEIFRAVERKDIMFLMEVRDLAFHLLLRKTGDATPLLHAMRIGEGHRDVAILLVGALSRWVNHLEDEDMDKPRTKVLLKALRTNLKLAIDYGLQKNQSDLLASFLQTLIMSEGEKWVWKVVSGVSLELRAGVDGKPVHVADTAVRGFATRELGKVNDIAALEDYVANATCDLLMMAAWSIVSDSVEGCEVVPAYYFARDDRVYNAFVERTHAHRVAIAKLPNKRLKWQLRVLEKVGEGRRITYKRKVETLREEFDAGVQI